MSGPEGYRVLVVDDSPFTRRTVRDMVARILPDASIELAGNGKIALAKAMKVPPSLVILDLAMPVMDGFTFLRLFRTRSAAPVLVVSSYADLVNVERALGLGASGFISKPENLYHDLGCIEEELRLKVRPHLAPQRVPQALPTDPRRRDDRPFPVIAIGASSGGPSTVQYLLSSLPAGLGAAVLIAQHMPPGFTESFARRLSGLLPVPVREARDGEAVRPGEVLVGPGGRHFAVVGPGDRPRVELREADGTRWVPSVDLLFRSCAETFGERLTAVVLTGMGNDGSDGVRAVKGCGGKALAESAETAAVFGMPREAAATGCLDEVLPLPEIAVRLIRTAEVAGDPGEHLPGPGR